METIFGAKWPQFKSSVLERWPKISEDTFARINGDRQKLISSIQDDYNITHAEAEKQVLDWERMQTERPEISSPTWECALATWFANIESGNFVF